MRKSFQVLAMIALVCLQKAALSAQISQTLSVVASTGGSSESEKLSISWTLGEISTTTLRGDDMILTQGFQQPFDFGVGIQKNEINWNIVSGVFFLRILSTDLKQVKVYSLRKL